MDGHIDHIYMYHQKEKMHMDMVGGIKERQKANHERKKRIYIFLRQRREYIYTRKIDALHATEGRPTPNVHAYYCSGAFTYSTSLFVSLPALIKAS